MRSIWRWSVKSLVIKLDALSAVWLGARLAVPLKVALPVTPRVPLAVMLEKVTLLAAPRPRLVRVAPGVPPEAKVSA
jgi:hypothetical protein